MSWGKTPEAVPPYVDLSVLPEGTELILVDNDESKTPENRAKGLRSPGWWLYRTWTNADGSVQHNAELLVAMSVPAAEAPAEPEAPVEPPPSEPEAPVEPPPAEPEAP